MGKTKIKKRKNIMEFSSAGLTARAPTPMFKKINNTLN